MATGEPPATGTTGSNRIPPPSKVTAGPPPAKVAAGPPPSSKIAAAPPAPKLEEPPPSVPVAPPPRVTGPQTSASPADVWPQYDQAPPAAAASEHAAAASEHRVQGAAKIGCLLPLTGAAGNFGQQALRGLRLALGEQGPLLVLKDVGNTPALALTAFDDLSRDPSILAVVGPLRSDYAETVAPEAERSRLPLFVLSQRDGLDTPYVMQVGLTRSRQVGTLLEYATTKARLRRFAVLYPDDTFGKEFVSAFQTEAQLRGAEVVGTEAYPPGEAGLSRKAGALRKWRDANDLQAIFLPDGVTPATRLAKFLQREMPDVTLLGTYGWEALAAPAEGAELNGVLFTDAFYADSARPATRDFVSRFTAAYGNPPGVLEAQAYDAGLLVKRALDAGARSRTEVMERLRAVGSLDGATGDLQVTPAGLQRSPFLLQVYDGKLQEVDTRQG